MTPKPNGADWLWQFLDYCLGERGYSEHTLSAYKSDLNKFRKVTARDLLTVSTDSIRRYVLKLLEDGASPKTARRKLSAIRSFYQFVFCEGGLAEDPTRHIRAPKAFASIVRPITRQEVDQTLASLGTERGQDVRNRAIVYTVYGSGVRVSELLRLKIQDIDFGLAVAKVRLGKGQKSRLVPMNQTQVEAIRLYVETVRPYLMPESGNDILFLGRRGERLCRQRVWQILTEISLKSVGRPISPHKYRHAFVTDTINGGAPFRIVQKMVGHAHIKTTMAYMHDDPQRIRAEYLKSHPRGMHL